MLQGIADKDLTIDRGIPYAAPPVGNLRWRAPQPASTWEGVRAAGEYGRACMQANPAIASLPAPSEDCLSVWPPIPAATRRPRRRPRAT
jgi:carboxylesterase type B